jgi:hypothetical protein
MNKRAKTITASTCSGKIGDRHASPQHSNTRIYNDN